MSASSDVQDTTAATLDLAELARVERGDRVEVGRVGDSTLELFDETLALVRREVGDTGAPPETSAETPRSSTGAQGFVPENDDLRSIYFLAEALGGYETFHDLFNAHSPGNALQARFREKAQLQALSDSDVRSLRDYQEQIHQALRSANNYLKESAADELSRDELTALHEVILTASARSKDINQIMGVHLMHAVENCVQRLHEIWSMTQNVDASVDGIFLVNSEVMFIPTNELIALVSVVFEAVGNSYLARNVDGVLLLAARNLIIDVCAFHSYYGKHQIYNALSKAGNTVNTALITARIRREISKLFAVCAKDNRLVLTRVMKDAEREFEISVHAIQVEAEHSAMEAVKRFLPAAEGPRPAPPKQGLLRRMLGWFKG